MFFLLIVSVLILIAFLIVLPPLWRKQPVEDGNLDERNIAIARQRLIELKEQLQAGSISQVLYEEQLLELEQALSDDLDIQSYAKPPSSQGRWIAVVLIFALPLLAGSLYLALGNYHSITPEVQTATNQASSEREQMITMVAGLAERLEKQPNDAEGWIMLGRSYKFLEQFPKAAAALEHAYKLVGDKPEVMLLYADALAYVNNEVLAGKPSELIFKALAIEPENVTGLWLGGMAKAQAGQFVEAMALWKRLEKLLPPESDGLKEIHTLMAQLETQMSESAAKAEAKPVQPTATSATSLSEASVDIQVSLSPELHAAPTDTVFVYAQALSGPQMPLAIVRKQVSDLPLTVQLTDAMAMMPTMKLSNFEQVKLLARISKSGNAMKQPGDFIGVIEQVALSDKSVHKIIINSQVK
jgi:cytochrome c-type biogenesis protein CcmH